MERLGGGGWEDGRGRLAAAAGDAQISREEGERAAPGGAGRSLGAGGVNRRGGGK